MVKQFPPIVMFTLVYPPDIGGLSNVVMNYACILFKHGHNVSVVVPLKKGLPKFEILNGIRIYRFPFDWDKAEKVILQNLNAQEFKIDLIHNIGEIFTKIGSSLIIHAHAEAIIAAGWLKEQDNRLQLVYSPHGSPKSIRELYNAKILGKFYRSALAKTDIIGYQLMDEIHILREFMETSNIREMINFIDPELFNPLNYEKSYCRKILDLPKNVTIIFSPTRLDEDKGLIELIKSLPLILQNYSDLYLYIAGSLTEGFVIDPIFIKRKIQRTVRKFLPDFSDRIRFTGAIKYQDMPKWYCACDLIVLLTHDECVPMCLLESMAMEKPIVTSNIDGIPKLLRNTPGRMIRVNSNNKVSHIEAAEVIIEELDKLKKKKKLSLNPLREKILNDYSPKIGYQKLKAIYSEVFRQN